MSVSCGRRTGGGVRKRTFKQDFKVLIAVIILDRNSKICFHDVIFVGKVIGNPKLRVLGERISSAKVDHVF